MDGQIRHDSRRVEEVCLDVGVARLFLSGAGKRLRDHNAQLGQGFRGVGDGDGQPSAQRRSLIRGSTDPPRHQRPRQRENLSSAQLGQESDLAIKIAGRAADLEMAAGWAVP
ncbi:hypothetical protein [Microlunatus elymi]|uniref:hypothetical protein n=1 Tax=Microlunatus elymi TaxID=2596828 RepID=UPI00389937F9